MFLSFKNAQQEQSDELNDDHVNIEEINDIEKLLSKPSKYFIFSL